MYNGSMTQKENTMTKLDDLIESARPINDDDWGSDRQVDAEADLFDYLVENFDGLATYVEDKSLYCKMTTDECLNLIANEIKSGKWSY
jgi:hypothetical protein